MCKTLSTSYQNIILPKFGKTNMPSQRLGIFVYLEEKTAVSEAFIKNQ